MKNVNTDIISFHSYNKAFALAIALQNLIQNMTTNLEKQKVLLIGEKKLFYDALPKNTIFYKINSFPIPDNFILPFKDCSFDYVIIFNTLEITGNDNCFIKEIWRIMEDGATSLLIIANPKSLWAINKKIPLKKGKYYSQKYLYSLLQNNLFTIAQKRKALLLPPFLYNTFIAKKEKKFEKILGFNPGIIALKSQKIMYASTPEIAFQRILSKPYLNT